MKIAIIGGGAAGIMVAATLIEEEIGGEIHLFEKNTLLGKKVSISGGGRCNVTTGVTDKNTLLSKYIRGVKFLIPSFGLFSPQKVMSWFENQGVPLKVEDGSRVFPVSDIGNDVVNVFNKMFKGKISLHLGEPVQNLRSIKTGFEIETIKEKYNFNLVVITSGGNAYKHTGSSGDGYDFAKSCGHSVTKLGPSLSSFETKDEWVKKLSGLSFQNAKLEVPFKDDKKISVSGPFLFTHFGISGPVTFALSAHLAFEDILPQSPIKVIFIPYADMSFDKWNLKIKEVAHLHGKRQIKQILSELMPKRFSEEILNLCKIELSKTGAQLTKDERKSIAYFLSGGILLTLVARRKGDEFVTAGGVCLDEIDKKTMQSKLIQNLYFAGEVLDIDGLTGGFNLQSAWATGRLAGVSIAKRIKEMK